MKMRKIGQQMSGSEKQLQNKSLPFTLAEAVNVISCIDLTIGPNINTTSVKFVILPRPSEEISFYACIDTVT